MEKKKKKEIKFGLKVSPRYLLQFQNDPDFLRLFKDLPKWVTKEDLIARLKKDLEEGITYDMK